LRRRGVEEELVDLQMEGETKVGVGRKQISVWVRKRRGVTLVDITESLESISSVLPLPFNLCFELHLAELNIRLFKAAEFDSNNQYFHAELINIHLKNLMVSVERSPTNLTISSSLSYFEIDNNFDLDSQHPVLLFSDTADPLPLKVHLLIDLAESDQRQIVVDSFQLIIGNFTLSLEDTFVEELMAVLKGTQSEQNLDEFHSREEEDKAMVKLKRLSITAIKGSFSYHVSPVRVYDKNFEKYSVLGVTSGGFEETKVVFKEFVKEYLHCNSVIVRYNLAN
jgi:hypothetical protein